MLKSRKPSGNAKVMYIPDAFIGNGYDAQGGLMNLQATLQSIGAACTIESCELRCMSQSTLRRRLQGVDAIYVDLGNTFYLRYYMRKSGFDDLVPSLLQEGVVYVGVSSGSICAGQSISTAFWKGWDDPGYGQEWDLSRIGYEGMNIIPGGKSVFPHFRGGEHEPLVQQHRPSLRHELVVLGDDHAYVVGGSHGECILTAMGEVCSVSSNPSTRGSPLGNLSPLMRSTSSWSSGASSYSLSSAPSLAGSYSATPPQLPPSASPAASYGHRKLAGDNVSAWTHANKVPTMSGYSCLAPSANVPFTGGFRGVSLPSPPIATCWGGRQPAGMTRLTMPFVGFR